MKSFLNILKVLCIGLAVIVPINSTAQRVKIGIEGCSKDTDCKGSRVCESEVCVAPSSIGSSKSNTPSVSEKSNACDKFYVGKAVDWGTWQAVITGIGKTELSMRVINSRSSQDIGRVVEHGCEWTAKEAR